MDSTRPEPTPQQAREQLAATQDRVLSSSRDRRVHAVGTAVVGVTIAAYGAAQTIVSGAAEVAFSVAFFALIFGQAWWVERAARTVPHRSKVISWTGIGASFVLGLLLVRPWLNLAAQTSPTTWPMVWAGSALAAVPALVAATVIAWRRD